MSSLSESLPDLQSCSSHDDEKCLCQELGSLCLDGTSDTCDDIPEHPSFMCRCDSPHSNQENQQPTDCCSTEFSTVTDSDIISISRNHQRLVDVHVVCPLQLTLQLDAEARKCTCYAQPTESTESDDANSRADPGEADEIMSDFLPIPNGLGIGKPVPRKNQTIQECLAEFEAEYQAVNRTSPQLRNDDSDREYRSRSPSPSPLPPPDPSKTPTILSKGEDPVLLRFHLVRKTAELQELREVLDEQCAQAHQSFTPQPGHYNPRTGCPNFDTSLHESWYEPVQKRYPHVFSMLDQHQAEVLEKLRATSSYLSYVRNLEIMRQPMVLPDMPLACAIPPLTPHDIVHKRVHEKLSRAENVALQRAMHVCRQKAADLESSADAGVQSLLANTGEHLKQAHELRGLANCIEALHADEDLSLEGAEVPPALAKQCAELIQINSLIIEPGMLLGPYCNVDPDTPSNSPSETDDEQSPEHADSALLTERLTSLLLVLANEHDAESSSSHADSSDDDDESDSSDPEQAPAQHVPQLTPEQQTKQLLQECMGDTIQYIEGLPLPQFPDIQQHVGEEAAQYAARYTASTTKFLKEATALVSHARTMANHRKGLDRHMSGGATARAKQPEVFGPRTLADDWVRAVHAYVTSSGLDPDSPRALATAATYLSPAQSRRWDQRKLDLSNAGKQSKFADFKAVVLTSKDGTHPADAARSKFESSVYQTDKSALENLSKFRSTCETMLSSCTGTRVTPVNGYDRFQSLVRFLVPAPESIKTVLLSESQDCIAKYEDADHFMDGAADTALFYEKLFSNQLDKGLSLARMLPHAMPAHQQPKTSNMQAPKLHVAGPRPPKGPPPPLATGRVAKAAGKPKLKGAKGASGPAKWNAGAFRAWLSKGNVDANTVSALYPPGKDCLFCGKDHKSYACPMGGAISHLPPARQALVRAAHDKVPAFLSQGV